MIQVLPVPREQVDPVVDMLCTVVELRRAAVTASRLRREGVPGGRWPIVSIEASARAEAYVRELTERVQSRARSAGMRGNDLLALAEAVIDGRRSLPAGIDGEAA